MGIGVAVKFEHGSDRDIPEDDQKDLYESNADDRAGRHRANLRSKREARAYISGEHCAFRLNALIELCMRPAKFPAQPPPALAETSRIPRPRWPILNPL